jgi:hypothetical protein
MLGASKGIQNHSETPEIQKHPKHSEASQIIQKSRNTRDPETPEPQKTLLSIPNHPEIKKHQNPETPEIRKSRSGEKRQNHTKRSEASPIIQKSGNTRNSETPDPQTKTHISQHPNGSRRKPQMNSQKLKFTDVQ